MYKVIPATILYYGYIFLAYIYSAHTLLQIRINYFTELLYSVKRILSSRRRLK